MEEIKAAVFESKADGSPGPDEILMRFYQQNWETVAEAVGKLVMEFQNGGRITSINYAWILILPMIEGASEIGDFRPISLANFSYKIIMKLTQTD